MSWRVRFATIPLVVLMMLCAVPTEGVAPRPAALPRATVWRPLAPVGWVTQQDGVPDLPGRPPLPMVGQPSVTVVVRPSILWRTPAPTSPPWAGAGTVHGVATWYDDGPGLYGAAGPALRTGAWRGRTVTVCGGAGCVTVLVRDWCACGGGRVIDLSPTAFRQLAPLSAGVVTVEIH